MFDQRDEQQEYRIVSADAWQEDVSFDNVLRPKTMEEYIGQEKVKEKLRIYIEAAKQRQEQLDHVLLYGPPGLGKTTLANIIAAQMGVSIRVTSGPALEKPKDLYGIIYNVGEHGVLFVDEIHRLNKVVEEYLYPAMEDFMLEWVTGQGAFAATQRQPLPKFTLIGATTRAGMISKPLRDRFGIVERMELYTREELTRILLQSSRKLGMEIESSGAEEIARRSRGTPRVANRLLKRVRDFAQVEADGQIDQTVAHRALSMLEVDHLGLDGTDRQILDSIIRKFAGGPVGLDTLAAATGEENVTIEDIYEPYLLQLGFLARTPRGRIATALAYEHLGLPPPKRTQPGAEQITMYE